MNEALVPRHTVSSIDLVFTITVHPFVIHALLSILYHLFIVHQVHLIHSTVVIHAKTNTRV